MAKKTRKKMVSVSRPKNDGKIKYKYKIGDKLIYTGKLYGEYTDQECVVKSRSKTRTKCWYTVEFADGFTMETYEQILSKGETS